MNRHTHNYHQQEPEEQALDEQDVIPADGIGHDGDGSNVVFMVKSRGGPVAVMAPAPAVEHILHEAQKRRGSSNDLVRGLLDDIEDEVGRLDVGETRRYAEGARWVATAVRNVLNNGER